MKIILLMLQKKHQIKNQIKTLKNNYQKFQKFLYKEMMKENKLQVMFF